MPYGKIWCQGRGWGGDILWVLAEGLLSLQHSKTPDAKSAVTEEVCSGCLRSGVDVFVLFQ